MKITADTNVLLRAMLEDDEHQTPIAQAELAAADAIAITNSTLCEFAWVLASGYKLPRRDIATTLRRLLDSDRILADRPSVEAGMFQLEAGGDFADGVIAHEGRWMGGEVFVSFDRRAVARLKGRNIEARLLG
jgi:predicted nucleic-acid-binding protein